jgi:hypothetical protein
MIIELYSDTCILRQIKYYLYDSFRFITLNYSPPMLPKIGYGITIYMYHDPSPMSRLLSVPIRYLSSEGIPCDISYTEL